MPYEITYDMGTDKYYVQVEHEGLNRRRSFSGRDPRALTLRAEQLDHTWAEEWARKRAQEQAREARQESLQSKKDAADQRTAQAQAEIESISQTLRSVLRRSHVVVWDDLKSSCPFPEPEPVPPRQPPAPVPPALPREPRRGDPEFLRMQKPDLLDGLSQARRQEKVRAAQAAFETRLAEWSKHRDALRGRYAAEKSQYERTVRQLQAAYEQSVREWQERRQRFITQQAQHNATVDAQADAYLSGTPEGAVAYAEFVLDRSEYHPTFPKEFEVEYNPDSGILIVEYSLPRPQDLPRLKSVAYVQSRDEMKETYLTERELNALYDEALYQITLRCIYEMFEADVIEAYTSVVFNGLVTAADGATGKQTTACVLSLHTTREEFLQLDLSAVDPKSCFRSLKGVGSSALHSLTPVPPVLTISRDDARFVDSYAVVDALDESANLAAMGWEDFEHLIREVFQAEFTGSGGEVKVTRASRDGGVDAIAFDPDPIRGGKIVIQAKRYTNTVGVSAVRDLYGTVVNEGATKGILVTTSDYGPDAYEFAKGKPLTLLNGGHLLHLLEKHGHRARIDLREAKRLLSEQDAAEI